MTLQQSRHCLGARQFDETRCGTTASESAVAQEQHETASMAASFLVTGTGSADILMTEQSGKIVEAEIKPLAAEGELL